MSSMNDPRYLFDFLACQRALTLITRYLNPIERALFANALHYTRSDVDGVPLVVTYDNHNTYFATPAGLTNPIRAMLYYGELGLDMQIHVNALHVNLYAIAFPERSFGHFGKSTVHIGTNAIMIHIYDALSRASLKIANSKKITYNLPALALYRFKQYNDGTLLRENLSKTIRSISCNKQEYIRDPFLSKFLDWLDREDPQFIYQAIHTLARGLTVQNHLQYFLRENSSGLCLLERDTSNYNRNAIYNSSCEFRLAILQSGRFRGKIAFNMGEKYSLIEVLMVCVTQKIMTRLGTYRGAIKLFSRYQNSDVPDRQVYLHTPGLQNIETILEVADILSGVLGIVKTFEFLSVHCTKHNIGTLVTYTVSKCPEIPIENYCGKLSWLNVMLDIPAADFNYSWEFVKSSIRAGAIKLFTHALEHESNTLKYRLCELWIEVFKSRDLRFTARLMKANKYLPSAAMEYIRKICRDQTKLDLYNEYYSTQ